MNILWTTMRGSKQFSLKQMSTDHWYENLFHQNCQEYQMPRHSAPQSQWDAESDEILLTNYWNIYEATKSTDLESS